MTIIVYAALVLIAVYHPYLNERIKFGTETGVGIAVLIAVIVQVVINHRRQEEMQAALKIEQDKLAPSSAYLQKSELKTSRSERRLCLLCAYSTRGLLTLKE